MNKYLIAIPAVFLIAACTPEKVCLESYSKDFVCVERGEQHQYIRNKPDYDALTIELQEVVNRHNPNSEALAQAIADLIRYE